MSDTTLTDAVGRLRAEMEYVRRLDEECPPRMSVHMDDIAVVLAAVERLGAEREAIRGVLSEGMHTGYRQGVDNQQAAMIHRLITDMPDRDWGMYVEYVWRTAIEPYLPAVTNDGGHADTTGAGA